MDPAGHGRGGPTSSVLPLSDLVARARSGEQRAAARLISLVEEGTAPGMSRPEIAAALPAAGRAHVVGLTGPPGVGKSTTASALAAVVRQTGRRVGVLAVDPSSPFSGGALLGDRVRMSAHAGDADVFVRSMANRGQLGGLAAAAALAVRILDAAGYDVVLVETVGVGQSEIDVIDLVDTTVLVLAPGMGDEIQAAKAGIMEIADLFVVNKADRDGAQSTVRDIRRMLATAANRSPAAWTPQVITTVATDGEGAATLLAALDHHRVWLEESGQRGERLVARASAEIASIVLQQVRERLAGPSGTAAVAALAAEVAAGLRDPYSAASTVLEAITPCAAPR